MPTREYVVKFSAPPAAILADLRQIEAALDRIEKQANQSVFAVRGLGGAGQPLERLKAELNEVRDDLAGVAKSAGGARTAVAGVGAAGPGAGTRRAGGRPSVGGSPDRPGFIRSAMDVKAAIDTGIGIARTAANAISGPISDASDQRREYYGTAAQKAAQFQQEATGYASLAGKTGVTPEIAQRIFKFARDAGIPVQDAAQFLDRFEGAAQLGIEKGNLGATPAEQDRLRGEITRVGSQFGGRVGIKADVAADLTAFIPQMGKIGSAEQFAGILGGAHYGVDQGKGDMGTLLSATIGTAATSVPSGRLSGVPEAAAWIGVLSGLVGKEGQVDERYRQVERFLGTSGKEGGADYLRSLGVDKEKTSLGRLRLVAEDVQKNKVTNVAEYFQSKGFTSSEERLAVEALLPEMATLESRVATANSYTAKGAEVLAKNAENQQTPLVAGKRATAALETSEIEQGMIQQASQNALTAAEARLRNPNQPGGDKLANRSAFMTFQTNANAVFGWLGGHGKMSADEIDIQREAIRQQFADAKGAGIDLAKSSPAFSEVMSVNGAFANPNEFTTEFNRNQQAIDRARGGRGGDPGKAIVAAGKLIVEAGRGLGGADGGVGGGGGGSAPVVDPKRR